MSTAVVKCPYGVPQEGSVECFLDNLDLRANVDVDLEKCMNAERDFTLPAVGGKK